MHSTLVAPLASSLESIRDSEAAVSRLVFCDRLAQALAAWFPGLSIRQAAATDAAAADTAARRADGPVRFSITLRGAAAELSLRLPWGIDAVSASVLGAGSWSSAVQLACLCTRVNSTLGGLLDWLGQLDLHPVQLDSHATAFTPPAGATRFECRLGQHRVDASLSCRDTAWLARATRLVSRQASSPMSGNASRSQQAPTALLARARTLALPVCVVLGTRRVSLRLLGSLQAGDVLVLDRTSGPGGAIDNATLLIGRRGRGALAWPCKVQGRLITATGDHWMNTETLNAAAARLEDAEPAADKAERGAGRSSMADLEVDLHIELQVLSTPLGELAAMQPGYVLELPMPAAEASVELVVGGRIYGRAQLVCVGDRLGARILEVFHDDA